MAVTITYNDEDHKDAINALKVNDFIHCMWELDQWLRAECKYNEKRTEKEIDAFYEAREKLNDLLYENGLKLYE
jgi:hypothetical protein